MAYLDLVDFVEATGGGRGEYIDEIDQSKLLFNQHEWCSGRRQMGFGRISFSKSKPENVDANSSFSKSNETTPNVDANSSTAGSTPRAFTRSKSRLYIRVPGNSNPNHLLYFMENVWKLPQPKLLIGITGGADNFAITEDLEVFLSDLVSMARHSNAWIITGGTHAGIMKYLGNSVVCCE